MKIPTDQIEVKKKIGKSGNSDIYRLKTRGGLHVVYNSNGTVLGSGPHRMVAQHIAEKFDNDIVWTELSKSDHYDVSDFAHVLPEYYELTTEMRKAQSNG